MLLRLAISYYRPNFTEGQAKLLVKDMVNDLDRYHVSEIEVAIQKYRRDAANKYFPRSGQLIELIEADRKDRRAAVRETHKRDCIPAGPDGIAYPDGKYRPLMWWHLSKQLWKPHWREAEVPVGELVRDTKDSPLRQPERFRS